MKKMTQKIILAFLLLSSGLFANNLSTVMGKLESSLLSIEKGFLYNQINMVENGAKEIKALSKKHFSNKQLVMRMMPKGKELMRNAAMLSSNKLQGAADMMLLSLKAKNISGAYDAYADIMKSCYNCHTLVRSW